METLVTTFIMRGRQKTTIDELFFNNAALRRLVIPMNSKPAFTGSFTNAHFGVNNQTWVEIETQMGEPIVDYDTSDKCRLYVTAVKALISKMK